FKQLSALGRADAYVYVFGAIDDAGHKVRNNIAGGHTAGGHIAGGHGHESAVSGEPAVSSLVLASPALCASEGLSELPASAFSPSGFAPEPFDAPSSVLALDIDFFDELASDSACISFSAAWKIGRA